MPEVQEIQFRDPAARVAAAQPIYSAPVGSPNEDLPDMQTEKMVAPPQRALRDHEIEFLENWSFQLN